MSVTDSLMEHTSVYRMWQAPFAEQKFAPVLASNDLRTVRSVLDVGCGPGTNAQHFAGTKYLGIDINEAYIRDAQRRYGREFIAADVCTDFTLPESKFDFILVNSFLHHLATEDVLGVLSRLSSMLTSDGHLNALELVMPNNSSLARLLAICDRGKFARPREEWQAIFEKFFEPVVLQSYPLSLFGATLWEMIYFKGRVRQPQVSAS